MGTVNVNVHALATGALHATHVRGSTAYILHQCAVVMARVRLLTVVVGTMKHLINCNACVIRREQSRFRRGAVTHAAVSKRRPTPNAARVQTAILARNAIIVPAAEVSHNVLCTASVTMVLMGQALARVISISNQMD